MKSNEKVDELKDDSGYFKQHQHTLENEKIKVASETLKLLKNSNSIVLDAGTSAMYVAEAIFSSKLKSLSILTHNIQVFLRYFDKPMHTTNHQLLLTGGCFDPEYNALYGFLTERAYEEFHPNVVILAISGLTASLNPSIPSGVYCHSVVETRVKEFLFALPVERRIIIADSSKIGKVDSHMFGDFSKIGSNLGRLGKAFVVTNKPVTVDNEEILLFEETVSALNEWNIDVKVV